MRIHFVSLFPEMVLPAIGHSILRRAVEAGALSFDATNPRDFANDPHRTVDEPPYGGGPGMVMRIDVLHRAIESLTPGGEDCLVLLDPAGVKFDQAMAREFARHDRLILICGHYEGVDERIKNLYPVRPVSIGDFVLTGGELPALVIADAVVRLLPGVLGDPESLDDDSHAAGLLGHPQYTRPAEYSGLAVPEVLRSGDHEAVRKWRRGQSLRRTRQLRPDLFAHAAITRSDLDLL